MGTVGRDDTGLTVERQCPLSTLDRHKQIGRIRPIADIYSYLGAHAEILAVGQISVPSARGGRQASYADTIVSWRGRKRLRLSLRIQRRLGAVFTYSLGCQAIGLA